MFSLILGPWRAGALERVVKHGVAGASFGVVLEDIGKQQDLFDSGRSR